MPNARWRWGEGGGNIFMNIFFSNQLYWKLFFLYFTPFVLPFKILMSVQIWVSLSGWVEVMTLNKVSEYSIWFNICFGWNFRSTNWFGIWFGFILNWNNWFKIFLIKKIYLWTTGGFRFLHVYNCLFSFWFSFGCSKE